MSEKPTFLHDCQGCVFLGTYQWQEGTYDLYVCKQGVKWPTVLARYSSDGPDYCSGLETAKNYEAFPLHESDKTHPLVEAMNRAKAHGHLAKKDIPE